MYSQVEDYLKEMWERLSPLPVALRNDERWEIRQHLENAVLINREHGQTEDEAVANALAQFGTPAEVAETIVGSWRKSELRNVKIFCAGMVCLAVAAIVEVFFHPNYLWINLFFLTLMLAGFGWKCLSPRDLPDRWAAKQRPIGLMPCVLFTALAPIWVVMENLNWRHSPSYEWQAFWSVAWYAIMTYGLWLRRYREQPAKVTANG